MKERIRAHGALAGGSADTLKSANEEGVVDLTPRASTTSCVVGWTADDCWILRNFVGTRRMPESIRPDLRHERQERVRGGVRAVPRTRTTPDSSSSMARRAHDVATPWLEVDVVLV